MDQFMAHKDVSIQKLERSNVIGLTFYFSDGHNQGTYQFKRLRELCPCRKPDGVLEIDASRFADY